MSASTAAVIIPAFSLDRWALIVKSVESVRRQTVRPAAIILAIDHNEALYRRALEQWPPGPEQDVRVIEDTLHPEVDAAHPHAKAHGGVRRFGGGSARNAGVAAVDTDIVIFLDDDAWAEPDWLAELMATQARLEAIAVGGPPLPDFERPRPGWFPRSFDWVFGCAYEGLPTEAAPLRHLFGGNLAVRRDAFEAVGGFHSADFDDLDLCMRLADAHGHGRLFFEPRAVIHHHVPADRVSWRYFYRRCYFVNREKVHAFRAMGSAANLIAEREFAVKMLGRCSSELRRGLRGEPDAFRRLGAMVAGLTLAAAGHVRGRLDKPRASTPGETR